MLMDQHRMEAEAYAGRVQLDSALRHAAALADARPRRHGVVRSTLRRAVSEVTHLHGHLRWDRRHPVWVRRMA